MRTLFFSFFLCVLALAGHSALAVPAAQASAPPGFDVWQESFRKKALAEGIRPETLESAFANISPLSRVIELDRKQPESRMSFSEYRNRIVNAERIRRGRTLLAEHRDILEKVSEIYGVAPQYIVALWGIESNFGSNTGGFDVIPALATLAWEGRRAEFFSRELIAALTILQEGHIDLSRMKGSWAGAMGQSQFMPSSFLRYAVDFDGDGRRDIWTTHADVFASAANYLQQNGWTRGQDWGHAVIVPEDFDMALSGLDTRKNLMAWLAHGVRLPDGKPVPVLPDVTASLVMPDGAQEGVFLVYGNFQTIMSWNRSTYFATSVGLLADAIAGQGER